MLCYECIKKKLLLAGALLLEEVVSSCGLEGIEAIIDAAQKRFNESQQGKVAGSAVWWRVSNEKYEVGFFLELFLSSSGVSFCPPVNVVTL